MKSLAVKVSRRIAPPSASSEGASRRLIGMEMGTRLLLVDEDTEVLDGLRRLLSEEGHDAVVACSAPEAALRLAGESFDLCLVTVGTTGVDGLAVLDAARRQRPAVPVIVLVAAPGVKEAVTALRAGAADFVPTPIQPDLLAETLRRSLGVERASNDCPRSGDGAAVIGEHPAMQLMLERIDQVADTDANVLIRGEAGTGTDLVARLVHAASARRGGPFVTVRAAGLPEALAEAELFGYPAAAGSRQGRIVAAHGGTLHVDEVAELPLALQERLLRVLLERKVQGPGDASAIPVDVRIVASTARNLEQLVEQGVFRGDLYYRLCVIPIEVPPLRARRDDVPLLADHFRREMNAREGRQVPAFTAEVGKRLRAYDWPGNVRQLESTVHKLVQAVGERAVTLEDLPPNLRTDVAELGVGMVDLPPYGLDLRMLLTQLEDRLIGQALLRTGGNKNRAAELLGMNRTTLVEKLRRRNVA